MQDLQLRQLLLRDCHTALRCRLPLQLAVVLLFFARPAAAQEPINADSATQPSPGHVTIKEQLRFMSLNGDQGSRREQSRIRDLVLSNSVAIGLSSDWSLNLRVPLVARWQNYDRGGTDREQGIGDVTTLVKWRFYRDDDGPLNTTRVALLGGMETRTGDNPFTNDAYNPILGIAATKIMGRHGLNGHLQWTFTTDGAPDPILPGMSTADVFRCNGAYLYRLSPAEFTAATSGGAWYAMIEANGVYETNGDHELLLAPGVMYEARTWVFELSVQLPVWREIDHRAKTEYVVIAGVRIAL